jgi:hypothetical protein
MAISRRRRSSRRLTLKLRHERLTLRHKDIISRNFHTILIIHRISLIIPEDDELIDLIFIYLIRKYLKVAYFKIPNALPQFPIMSRTIASFSESDTYLFFRFNKSDLYRLLVALKMPEVITVCNGSTFTGEEVMLFSLRRYASNSSLEIDARLIFERDNTQWSRAFHWFNRHMVRNFVGLLCDNMQFWLPYLQNFSNKIADKVRIYLVSPYFTITLTLIFLG